MTGLNDFVRQWQDTRQDALAAFETTGASGWYILGREVEEFEAALAEYWGIPHAVAVGNGMDAIEISLRAVGCKAGDKVLTTALSAFATTLAIVRLGAVPVFADIDASGLVDLDAASDALRRDPSIRYFVPVHLFGHALDLRRLASVRDEFGIVIVEDCAQSIGALSGGTATGTVGTITATSFYPTKNLGALGDGGALLTSDEDCAATARALRDYGQTGKYRHDVIGYNSRLDELQAALLRRVQLPRLDAWTAARRGIASRYLEGIRNPAVGVPPAPQGSESSWHLFPLLVDPLRKEAFIAHLRGRDIATGQHYPIAMPDQKALDGRPFEIAASGITKTRRFCASEVSLPVHPYLLEPEITAVIDAVNRWSG